MPILRTTALGLALAAACGATASAQQTGDELRLPEHMDRALREMMEDMKPALDEMMESLRTFGDIGDPRNYEMPEVLPNGDIIIRRREGAPPYRPEEPEEQERVPQPIEPEEGIRT